MRFNPNPAPRTRSCATFRHPAAEPSAHQTDARKAPLDFLSLYESVSEAKAGIARYVAFYNTRRPHRALDGESPDAVYFKSLPLAAAA